eukprot:CAMPEP_0171163264 /NCGR_PEP_ID=MMETSP0790-20130122/5050_1 /TAXON_ID=2925 /ORGANISM="Alexandrium catenella, Strain OF101" /LENGTH=66 /DNA_ID=CAMNT_0011627957 /DNA_START=128 /DNA_END=328 /DNA_ORIENTATION=-
MPEPIECKDAAIAEVVFVRKMAQNAGEPFAVGSEGYLQLLDPPFQLTEGVNPTAAPKCMACDQSPR